MPNTKSAKKRLRQNVDRRQRNRSVKSALRTILRKFRETVAAGSIAEAEAMIPAVSKRVDQAAAKRVIHPNKAARVKSRLARLVVRSKQSTAV
jgi:small subunit ribosomal protein S20